MCITCTNTTRHAIFLLSILSLLLLINLQITGTNHQPLTQPEASKGGGGDTITPTTTTSPVTAFLSGVLFTSVMVMVIISTSHHLPDIADDPDSVGPTTFVVPVPRPQVGDGDGRGGVGEDTMRTLPTFSYSTRRRPRMGKGAWVCVICQKKFRDEQLVRLLPDCDHIFHISCIDRWLTDHKSCPSCRADLELLPPPPQVYYYDHVYQFQF